MSLRLEEIAQEAGVSRSTVSRVLNKEPHVSARARERVLAVTQPLNFHPNATARSLAAGRTRNIGLVIPVAVSSLFTDPYFPLLIQGITSACNTHDYSVMLWLADVEQERQIISKITHSGMVDGVIVASALMDDPMVQVLLEDHIPFVQVGRHPTDERVSYVDVDNYNSAKEVVGYLLRLGYRRVATIAGPHNMIAGHDRRRGYQDALRARGMIPDPALIAEGDFLEDGGFVAMQQLLARARQPGANGLPDAVFVASDMMATGALRALRDAGIRVPGDMAVVGYDDMPFAARTEPPLTTVRQPIHRAGAVAAETLFELIENPNTPPRRIILPTELVIRASTGPGV
ncbi:MAG: LacI family DNA-binding transcriptional regulator [Chloroflexi bacterium]|nr:LacI family DNA-binding transcriptional regulator [Chloroflexota bacterium]